MRGRRGAVRVRASDSDRTEDWKCASDASAGRDGARGEGRGVGRVRARAAVARRGGFSGEVRYAAVFVPGARAFARSVRNVVGVAANVRRAGVDPEGRARGGARGRGGEADVARRDVRVVRGARCHHAAASVGGAVADVAWGIIGITCV